MSWLNKRLRFSFAGSRGSSIRKAYLSILHSRYRFDKSLHFPLSFPFDLRQPRYSIIKVLQSPEEPREERWM